MSIDIAFVIAHPAKFPIFLKAVPGGL